MLAAPVAGSPDPPGPEPRPSAAELFERTLAAEGLGPALDRLAGALADTAAWEIDPWELAIGLPARLVAHHRRTEALELLKALQPLYGDDPRYQELLGTAHLRCGNAEEARVALAGALDRMENRPDLAWTLQHVDELAAVARLQGEREDRLVPGESTGLDGPCLGQTPPGRVPEVFAPGILSTTAHEYHVSFAPDGREILFSRSGVGTLVSRWKDDGWTVPEPLYFLDEDHLTEEANFTPDGRAVVFCGRASVREPRVLYRAERVGEGWGEPVELFPGMYATSTRDGSLYYTARGEGRDIGAIVRRPRLGDGYGDPVVVAGEGINTEFPDAHPWIAPDESLLLFDTYRDPDAGIYVAFRRTDGTWSPAVPLCDKLGIPPVGQTALSPDGKYLFFCMAGDIYWVDAGFLDELRPDGATD